MRFAAGLATLLLVALSAPPFGAAQDAHYWNYGYGPIGQLTEGVLVGGVSDISAVYYNPGALALLDNPRFLLGLTSVEIASLEVPGAAGEHLDVDQLIFDIVPSMVGGAIGEGGGANRFAVALLSRSDSDWDLGYTDVRITGAASDAGAGFGRARQRLVEYWLGGTWSHRFSERLSIGVSPFIAYREQRSRRSLTACRESGGRRLECALRRLRARVHPRAGPGQGRGRLASRKLAAGDDRHLDRLRHLRQGKAILNTSLTGDVASRSYPLPRRMVSMPTITLRGPRPPGLPGDAARGPSTPPPNGSRRWTNTSSSRPSRRRSLARPIRFPFPIKGNPRASSTTERGSSAVSAGRSSSTAGSLTTSPPTWRGATPSRAGT